MDSVLDDEWELCNADGFIYKRKKRRLSDHPPPPAVQSSDPAAEEKSRRERRRITLLKLKKQYQLEIDQWELLSNSLCAMQEKQKAIQFQSQQQNPLRFESQQQNPSRFVSQQQNPLSEFNASELGLVQRSEDSDSGGFLVDELLLQAEAQQAIICDASNLCNVAETMCDAQEGRIKKLYIDLPVWASPQDLMASLCEE